MASKDINFDDSQLREFSEHVGRWPQQAAEGGRVALEKSMRRTLQRIVRERLSGQDVLVRSGMLRRSGSSGATIEGSDIVGAIHFRSNYARSLEYGADIKPGPGKKFLTIPLTAAMTDRGVARGTISSFPDIVFRRVRTPFVDPFSGKTIPAGALVAFQRARQGQRMKGGSSALSRRMGRQFGKSGSGSQDPLADQVRTGELVPLFWMIRHARIKPRSFARSQLRHDTNEITADVVVGMRKALTVK